ncbi:MAG: hypothetical protein AMXMBFR13_45160 [Phycisphaerae bacterium]
MDNGIEIGLVTISVPGGDGCSEYPYPPRWSIHTEDGSEITIQPFVGNDPRSCTVSVLGPDGAKSQVQLERVYAGFEEPGGLRRQSGMRAAPATLPSEDPSRQQSRAKNIQEPDSQVHELCERGQYRSAARALAQEMQEWAKYTEATGSTSEGAAGYLYATTMFTLASKGDKDWGKILDAPEIPYNLKLDMIFEILEARLGKGAVHLDDEGNLVAPREPAVSDQEHGQ